MKWPGYSSWHTYILMFGRIGLFQVSEQTDIHTHRSSRRLIRSEPGRVRRMLSNRPSGGIFFYVYEGAPSNDAISLFGHLSGKNLSIQGDWVEHLIEYPSKKETVQTHFVKIDGAFDSASFRGEV